MYFFEFSMYYGHSPLQFVLYVGMENYCISIPVKHQSLYWCVCASNHSVVPEWDQIVFLSTNHTVTQWCFQSINNSKRVIQDVFQIHLNIRTSINNSTNQRIRYFEFYILLIGFENSLASFKWMIAVWTPHIVGKHKQWMCLNLKTWRRSWKRPVHEIKSDNSFLCDFKWNIWRRLYLLFLDSSSR